MNVLLFLVYFLIFASASYSQGWIKIYGGDGRDAGFSVQQTADSGYIVAGTTSSFGSGLSDFYLIKTDKAGDTLWTKTYGGVENDSGWSCQQTNDGGYIFVGSTSSFGAGLFDIYIVKTNSNGDTLWTKTYGGTSNDMGYSVQQTTDGGYIIAGFSGSFGTAGDVWLLKTNSNGDTLWTKTYGGDKGDFGFCVKQTGDRGYIISGWTYSFGSQWEDVYLVKTDERGDTIWTRRYGGGNRDYGYSVYETSDSGYVITGFMYSYGNFPLIKTDVQGNIRWIRSYGLGGGAGYSVQETIDGGYIIAGYERLVTRADVTFLKTKRDGISQWRRWYGGEIDDIGYSVQQTNDGGYIVAGYTESFGVNGDVYLIKTDSQGSVGIEEKQLESYRVVKLTSFEVYPNPATSVANLRLQISDYKSSNLSVFQSSISIKIYDVQGRLVRQISIANSKSEIRNSNVVWDLRDEEGKKVSAGVYFVRLETASPSSRNDRVEEKTQTKRIIVLR